MFDILVYLFENYFEADLHPDQGALVKELADAGYDRQDISLAFDWLQELEGLDRNQPYPDALADSRSIRCYAEMESKVLDADCRGFLIFLEVAGILNPIQREWVIERALALPDADVSLEQVKWIVLMVLYSQGQTHDYLFMEELLFGTTEPQVH